MLTTQLVTNTDELAALAGPWNELSGGEPLRSWNWLATWWKHYGAPDNGNGHSNRSSLHVIAVYDRNALPSHELVGIAPWYLDRTKSKRGVLRPLGSGEVCTDHLSLICRPETATDVATAVADYLIAHEDSWDRLDMPFVDADDPAVLALTEVLSEHDCLVSAHAAGNCWSFELPPTWDEYVKSLSRSHRRQLSKAQDRVVKPGRTQCHVVTSADQLEQAWNVLRELHQRRWTGLGESGVFASERFHNFHREAVSLLLAAGQLRMSWVDLDGTPVSAEYHLAGPQTVYTYQSGIDSDRLDESPGRLAYMLAIRRAVEDGYKCFDFLRGDEPYKAHFRAVARPTFDYRIFPNRRIARLRGCMTHAAISFKRFVKRHVKPAQHYTLGLAAMNFFKENLLRMYYAATTPARRRDAIDRAARYTEPVRILFYHRVADEHPNDWTISTKRFAAQLEWMQPRFDIISLAEAQDRIASGRNRWPSVCITFDDGYADNCNFAIPLLLQRKIPFTYFVSTYNVLHGRPFEHDVALDQPLAPNTPPQLREMAAAGVEIGAHTRNHVHLGQPISPERLVDEIVGCKLELEDTLRIAVRYFAFPFGQVRDLSTEAFQVAYRAGYRGVCSAFGGYNFPGDDPFHLRRIHADPEFIRLKNWLDLDPRKLDIGKAFNPGDYKSQPFEVSSDTEDSALCHAAAN